MSATDTQVRAERDKALQQLASLREAGQRFVDGELSVDGFEAALEDAYDEAAQYQRVPEEGVVVMREAAETLEEGMALLADVSRFIGGWRELIADLDDLSKNEATGKAMWAALDQIDRVSPRLRMMSAKAKGAAA